ncbi:MAG: hypothetical protein LBT06_04110 [Hungatella sp.]|jgi:hypothetical protein|nr:hypothetical protein [Hungatella sp.]
MERSRLVSIPEFQKYAGNIGRNSALRLAKEAQIRVKIGRRLLIDVQKFDDWVSENAN